MNDVEDTITEILHGNRRLAEAVGVMTTNAQSFLDSYQTVLRICQLNHIDPEPFEDMLGGRFDITIEALE